jgi:myo-inositol-1-phosphate synthase
MTETKISSNGASRYQSGKVRVAIIGVGNCASSLVQGVEFYKDADPNASVPGLMHVDLGGYHISDIEFSAAFDIDADKVGKDLSEAIWSGQNNTIKFSDVPNLDVPVHRGMTHDGLGKYLKEKITKAPGETDDIVKILKETKTDVVVSYLPVGSEQATKWYVEQVLEAGCGFVNCIPVFIAKENYWAKRFEEHGLPIIGDDIKSQVGATIVHRMLARLFHERGVEMKRTSQLNVGGNMDFYNMLERERLESKKISKTNAVTSIMGHELPADDVYIGPSDYVPWLTDRKWAHIRLQARPEPRARRPDRGRLGVPDEVAAGAAPGPGRAPDGRGLHRGARRGAEAARHEAGAGAACRSRGRDHDRYRLAPYPARCAVRNRAGHPLALGAASRGQPLRRTALGRAVRPRPPCGGHRAVRLA